MNFLKRIFKTIAGSKVKEDKKEINYEAEVASQPNLSDMTPEERFLEVKKRAEKGDASCMMDLGIFYLYGMGTGVDINKGLIWARKAADLNDLMGIHNMGVFYQEGKFVKQDYQLAIQFFKKASERKLGRSTNTLGVLAQRGLGMPQNYSVAKDYYLKAIEQEEWIAYENLAFLYLKGNGVNEDFYEATKLFQKAEEKKVITQEGINAFSWALFRLYIEGVDYAMGYSLPIDKEKAWKYIRICSINNYAAATKFLLLFFYKPDLLFLPLEISNVKRLPSFQQTDYIEKTIINIRSFSYSSIRETEKGVNSEEADELCYGALLSMYGVYKFDNLSHIELLKKSIERGFITANFWLAYCYEMGLGVEKSAQMAIECYTAVVKSGHSEALFSMGFQANDGDAALAEAYYRIALISYKDGQHSPEEIRKMLSYKYGNNELHTQSMMLFAQTLIDEGKEIGDDDVMNILTICANHYNEKALYLLANYYIKLDLDKARYYLKTAIDIGNLDAVKLFVDNRDKFL